MAPYEVIDLSLSTDEDESPPNLPPPLTTSKGRFFLGDLIDLSDELNFPCDNLVTNGTTEPATTKLVSATLAQQIKVREHTDLDVDDFGVPAAKRRRASPTRELPEPILFTSSPRGVPKKPCANKRSSKAVQDLQSELDDYLSDTLERRPTFASRFSSRTEALLQDIDGNTKRARKKDTKATKPRSKESKVLKVGTDDSVSITKTQSPGPQSTLPKVAERTKAAKKVRLTSAERESKEHERERAKIQKEKEKERKKLAREEKEREKQIAAVLAEVNKSKLDKKTSTPEMIVDLPASIRGQSVDTQVREFLNHLGVEISTREALVPNVIRWRRKVKSRFNQEIGHWEPMTQTITTEKHIMCLVSAKEFVSLAVPKEASGEDLEGHVLKLKNTFPGCVPIYLIEGLDVCLRKAKNSKNRAYQAAVLGQTDNPGECNASQTIASKSKRKQPEEQFIDEDLVEDALLRLQVIEGCLVHHTAVSVDSAEWITSFTQHISTIPYK